MILIFDFYQAKKYLLLLSQQSHSFIALFWPLKSTAAAAAAAAAACEKTQK